MIPSIFADIFNRLQLKNKLYLSQLKFNVLQLFRLLFLLNLLATLSRNSFKSLFVHFIYSVAYLKSGHSQKNCFFFDINKNFF